MIRPEVREPPPEVLSARRSAAAAALDDGVMLLVAAPLQYSSRDNERRYRPDSELYYLTGATEPDTVAVLVGGPEPELVLFVRERDEAAELWSGARLGPEAAAERFGADRCHPLSGLSDELPALLRRGDRIHFRLGGGGPVESLVLAALAHARARGPRTGSGPRGVIDPGEILDDLRLRKDEHELALLRTAAAVTLAGHRAGASTIAPGVGEWVVEAAVEGAFRVAGAAGPGFATIVGSGRNACVLHYVDNHDVITAGDLVLVDAGAACGLYNADVTRTYPAGGRFEGARRDVYEIVHAALRAAVARVAPGAVTTDVHGAATRVLVEGLVGLGVLSGDVNALIEDEAYKPYYPHQTSHWLGLDLHDPGDYARGGAPRELEPGMVFTVEPGLYFRGGDDGRAAAYEHVGVRIEDDVLVTEKGCEVLTADLPTDLHEVEALVRDGR